MACWITGCTSAWQDACAVMQEVHTTGDWDEGGGALTLTNLDASLNASCAFAENSDPVSLCDSLCERTTAVGRAPAAPRQQAAGRGGGGRVIAVRRC
eukprot:365674-Chlamydomonas_euryale.AAC.9